MASMVSFCSTFSSFCVVSVMRSRSNGRLICKSSSERRWCGWSEKREWDSARASSRCLTRFASSFIFSWRTSVLARTKLTYWPGWRGFSQGSCDLGSPISFTGGEGACAGVSKAGNGRGTGARRPSGQMAAQPFLTQLLGGMRSDEEPSEGGRTCRERHGYI